MSKKCENCDHWGALTWKCVHPRGHKSNETAYPGDTCKFFKAVAPGKE